AYDRRIHQSPGRLQSSVWKSRYQLAECLDNLQREVEAELPRAASTSASSAGLVASQERRSAAIKETQLRASTHLTSTGSGFGTRISSGPVWGLGGLVGLAGFSPHRRKKTTFVTLSLARAERARGMYFF